MSTSDFQNDFILNEYNTLRQELLDLSSRQLNTLSLAITVTLGLIGFSIQLVSSSDHPQFLYSGLLSLSPLIILYFAGLQIQTQSYTTMRIASFIAINIEEKWLPHYRGWETCMGVYRRKGKLEIGKGYGSSISWKSYQFVVPLIGYICIVISLVFLILALNQQAGPEPGFIILVIVLFLFVVLWSIFTKSYFRMLANVLKGEVFDQYSDFWKNIEKDEADN